MCVKAVKLIIAVVLAGALGYVVLVKKPAPTEQPNNDRVLVSLRQQLTLKKGQVAKIANTGLEIEITAFFNSPCEGQCFWSGVGVEFEYRFNGEVQKGINLVQAFGYQTTIVNTDHETYANLVVEKMK